MCSKEKVKEKPGKDEKKSKADPMVGGGRDRFFSHERWIGWIVYIYMYKIV